MQYEFSFLFRRKSIYKVIRIILMLPYGIDKKVFCIAAFVLVIVAVNLHLAAAAQDTPVYGLPELSRLDLLPRFKNSANVASISSYDRTGGNDDGFSGKYSFVRKEGDGLVIADLKGPGVIYRIWTPTPTDEPIEFYFDGETTPRIQCRYRQLFDGSKPPFNAPLAGFGSGGFYSYLPLPYKTSCKIIIRAPKVQFYQINYATYPADAPIQTFVPDAPEMRGTGMQQAQRVLGMAGKDFSALVVPEGTRLQVTKNTRTLAPGKSVTLFERRKGGRIAGIRLSPASAFAGKDRALILKITWDGAKEPAVLCPAGDFFGYSWGDPAARSLLVGRTEYGLLLFPHAVRPLGQNRTRVRTLRGRRYAGAGRNRSCRPAAPKPTRQVLRDAGGAKIPLRRASPLPTWRRQGAGILWA